MAEKQTNEPETYALAPVQLFNNVNSLPLTAMDVCEKPCVYSTYNITSPEVRGEVYDVMIQGGDKADNHIGEEFAIEHVTVFPVTFTDKKTGELVSMPLVLLKTDTGVTIQFVSKGIWGSLIMMRALGYAPFGPNKQRFKLAQVPLDDGKRFYQLHRVIQKAKPAK